MKRTLNLIILLLTLSASAQYPMLDHFTAIGGANQWYKSFGGAAMGVDGGTNLCYNIATSYANATNYSFQSPNYGTKFATDGCVSIKIRLSVIMNIRNSDNFYFFVYDVGWTGYSIPSSGTYQITLPKTSKYFSFDFYTGSSGSKAGRYVHVDWFEISCVTPLPISLISFTGTKGNKLEWVTETEINNDCFILESSLDGISWKVLYTLPGAGNSLVTSNYTYLDNNYERDTINYYRLSQIDFDGDRTTFEDNLIAIDNRQKIRFIVNIYNMLGQSVDLNTSGVIIIVYSDGTLSKIVNK